MSYIKFDILESGKRIDNPVPEKATEGSAGFDLRAAIEEPIIIPSGYREMISNGFRMAIPAGHVALVCPRSGLASDGLTVANSPGIIDSDYRGPIKTILQNLSKSQFEITPGMRIAQLLLIENKGICYSEVIDEDEELPSTKRGQDGFGSTGLD